jgi:hypothetical protein
MALPESLAFPEVMSVAFFLSLAYNNGYQRLNRVDLYSPKRCVYVLSLVFIRGTLALGANGLF